MSHKLMLPFFFVFALAAFARQVVPQSTNEYSSDCSPVIVHGAYLPAWSISQAKRRGSASVHGWSASHAGPRFTIYAMELILIACSFQSIMRC